MGFRNWVVQLVGRRVSPGSEDWSPLQEEWPEWRRRWQMMPHRRLVGPARFDYGTTFHAWGKPIAAMIVLAPPEHAHRLFMTTRNCPICGGRAARRDGVPAMLSPIWRDHNSILFPAWVHPACFDALPDAEPPVPFPW